MIAVSCTLAGSVERLDRDHLGDNPFVDAFGGFWAQRCDTVRHDVTQDFLLATQGRRRRYALPLPDASDIQSNTGALIEKGDDLLVEKVNPLRLSSQDLLSRLFVEADRLAWH